MLLSQKPIITDYREYGVFALELCITLTMSNNNVVGSGPDSVGIIWILFVLGATGIITQWNYRNICKLPDCEQLFNHTQAFGKVADSARAGSVISKNYISNNDAGIGVFGESGCCNSHNNKLTDNRLFGIVIGDGNHTISNTKIFGRGCWNSSSSH